MRFSHGLPTHRVDRGDELVSAAAIAELAAAAEGAGFDAVYTTEHPFPDDGWLAHGGHHALDPLVALSFAAAATSRIRLHTNLFILGYRNPFLAAKGLASLSGGRLIVGVGAGYLENEFAALGAGFADRNDRLDEGLRALQAAWSGPGVVFRGAGFEAVGNTMLPRPLQQPRPPIWIGGNSRRAIRRAVELADGWSPFPAPAKVAGRNHTAALATVDDLAERLAYARAHATAVGRQTPLDVCYVPAGLRMGDPAGLDDDPARLDDMMAAVVASCHQLAGVGITWASVALPGDTRQAQLEAIDRFGHGVLATFAGR